MADSQAPPAPSRSLRNQSAAQDELFGRLYGLRRTTARRCPYVVAGQRCELTRKNVVAGSCLCHRYRRILDHPRMWLAPDRRRVLTSEPYTVPGDELASFIADMAELGLSVNLTGRSGWYPGATFTVMVTPGDPLPERRHW